MRTTLPEVFDLHDDDGRFAGRARRIGRMRLDAVPIGGLFIEPRNEEIASHIGAYSPSRSGEREIAFTSGITVLAMPDEMVEAVEMVTPDPAVMVDATAETTREGDLIYVQELYGPDKATYSAIVRTVGSDEHGSYFGVAYFHAKSGTAWNWSASTTTCRVTRYPR